VKYLLAAVLFTSCFITTACDSKLSAMEGGELRKRAYLGVIETNMSTVEIQICNNIQRECERRQGKGIFDC
jgi:hypothetical protein